ncbi:hypothetical protein [Caballeronia sp. LZ034LL]|uniref:hypothetical protein n=1 Tax=Caballeronia sp. LZ034LL TaxID=3038567 RepID=UPI00285D4AAD|nr:hypothetical protein [Caballeronia sp. LZ034LL]MDR5836948.1 hypothetical protein [Caballeronia sp. LZ034LL]
MASLKTLIACALTCAYGEEITSCKKKIKDLQKPGSGRTKARRQHAQEVPVPIFTGKHFEKMRNEASHPGTRED